MATITPTIAPAIPAVDIPEVDDEELEDVDELAELTRSALVVAAVETVLVA